MNIRHTKPGHIYGVSDRRKEDAIYWSTIFPVRALAIGDTYEKAVPATDYWSKSNGTAKGLTVEILETVLDPDGDPKLVRLPGMANTIEVKEGNKVVISGRSIHWTEEEYRAVAAQRAEREAEDARRQQEEEQRLESLKDRLRALGLGEWAEVDAPTHDWYPPEVYDEDSWDKFLTVLEGLREGVNA